MREKIIKSANFLFGIVFYCSQKRCLQNTDRATLKVKIEDGRLKAYYQLYIETIVIYVF